MIGEALATFDCCQARTTPATVLRSARPIAERPSELGGDHQFLGLGGAAQEREIRLDGELGIGDGGSRVHAKTPCMNQRGDASAAP